MKTIIGVISKSTLARDMPSGPYLHLPNIIKIFQTIKKLWSAQESCLEIRSGEITGRRPEMYKVNKKK